MEGEKKTIKKIILWAFFSTLWYGVKSDCPTLHSVWSKLADQTTQLADNSVTYPKASGNIAHTQQLLRCDAGKISSHSLEGC